ncbi:carboxypeptidase-like regulatory domain-containing protein [Lacipirellula sp.]|uniref:carboxypeptidase-like regulatory domain-containing protein n=1 Tax=Lacipirellula sp. TaxID=2691419 RepID=UPI003D0BE7B0
MAETIRPVALLILAVAVGCGSGSSEPVTYPVTGKVTIGGAPVAGADVTFVPQSADLGIGGATAQTGPDGSFNVKVMYDLGKSSKEGLPAGDYRVFVIKLEQPSGPPSLSKPPKNTLPQKYASPDTSNLSATVKADGENLVELKLE